MVLYSNKLVAIHIYLQLEGRTDRHTYGRLEGPTDIRTNPYCIVIKVFVTNLIFSSAVSGYPVSGNRPTKLSGPIPVFKHVNLHNIKENSLLYSIEISLLKESCEFHSFCTTTQLSS